MTTTVVICSNGGYNSPQRSVFRNRTCLKSCSKLLTSRHYIASRMASHEARAEALSNDDPSISIPFTPRDEDNDIHKDNIVDLADFLKDTSPPTQQQRRFSRPATTTKGPRKLRKKSLRASVPVQDISLEGFTPKGVEERVSKDGQSFPRPALRSCRIVHRIELTFVY